MKKKSRVNICKRCGGAIVAPDHITIKHFIRQDYEADVQILDLHDCSKCGRGYSVCRADRSEDDHPIDLTVISESGVDYWLDKEILLPPVEGEAKYWAAYCDRPAVVSIVPVRRT